MLSSLCEIFQECTRKENEYTSNAVSFKDKYQTVCKQMGIKVHIYCTLTNFMRSISSNIIKGSLEDTLSARMLRPQQCDYLSSHLIDYTVHLTRAQY